jgi:hypothetical protein
MYQISDINFDETKTADFNYIDVDKNIIKDKDIISVQITAKDNVGLSIYKSIAIDLRKPELTLEMGGNSELLGNKVALKERLQDFTIKSVPTESIKMTGFTLTLTNGSETISEAGDFVGNSGSSQFTFNDSQQGEYTLTLVAIDSIGRDIASFTYESMDFGASGATTYVDFSAPTIGAISGEQITPLPTNDLYKFDVKSVIQDANLNQNSIVSTVTFNSKSYSPTSMTKPSVVGEPYVFHYSVPAGTYVATVKATDFINQENSNTGSIEVAEATVPELTITSSHNDLGSEANSTITFSFSEDVIGFTKDDVVLSASDSGATGTLDMSTWSAGPAQSWTAIYTAPKGENKTVTISVAEGSYTSTITVDGNAATGDIAIKGVLPTVSNTVFNPIHADNLKTVEVKVDFSASVSDVKATLLTAPVSWISGQGSDKWVGNVVVPASSDDQLILVVSEFTDTYGNVGEADNSGVLYLTPLITVTPISGGAINETGAANLIISGTTTRFEAGKEISVAFSNSADAKSDSVIATVGSDGRWTAAGVNLSSWTDGSITVKATGSNQHNIAAKEATTTAQLSTEKPTLTSVVSNPTSGKTGDKIGVTATFSVAVSNATAKLSTSDVMWTSGQDTAIWVGEVAIPSSLEADTEFAYTVQGFSDTNGNLGDSTINGVVYLTPSIIVDAISGGVINSSDITNVVVSGDTSRFDDSQKVTLVLSNNVDAQTKNAEANIQSDGSWSMAAQDLTGWPDSEVTATVTGSNQHSIAAEAVTETANLSAAKPTVSSVTLNPVTPSNGDSVQVTIRFNENVSNVSGTLGQPIDFSPVTAPAIEWIGTIASLNVGVESYKDLIVSADYENAFGNKGDAYNEQVAITPEITLGLVAGDDVIGTDDSDRLVITGTSLGFAEGDNLNIIVQSVDQGAKNFNQTVQVQRDGTWTTTTEDISGWNNSDITVTLDGRNSSSVDATTISKTIPLDNSIAFVYRDDWLIRKAA